MTETKGSRGFTRRSFIKGVAAVTAAGALAGCTPKEDDKQQVDPTPVESPDQIFAGACRGNCGCGCFLNIHVRDGQVVRTSARDLPDKRLNRICVKGLTHPFRMYGPDRIKYPMRRIEGTERGAGQYERITWEEALDTIAEKWKGYVDEFGPTAISFFWHSGNYGVINGCNANPCAINRFVACAGIPFLYPAVDAAAGIPSGRAVGYSAYCTGNDPTDFKNSKTFLVWGANPVVSQIQSMHFLTEAREQGTNVIVIDPVFSQTAALADKYVPIKGGTDGALAMGMMYHILEQGWEDVEFLKKNSVAACLVKESDGTYLRQCDIDGTEPEEGATARTALVLAADGTVGEFDAVADPVLEGTYEKDGIKAATAYSLMLERIAEYPVEKASEITGVPAEEIKELARQFAQEGPSAIYTFFGVDHYYNAHWSTSCMTALSVITGNLGQPGSFIGMNEQIYVYGDPALASPEGAPGNYATFQFTYLPDAAKEGTFMGQPYNPKLLFIANSNMVANMSDRNKTLEWVNAHEFTCGMDFVMTDSMNMCDIVLPAAHWFEVDDMLGVFAVHPYMLIQEKAVEPAFEARPDLDVYCELATRLGFGDIYNITTEEYMRAYFAGGMSAAEGMTLEKFREEKAIIQTGGDGTSVHGNGGVFPTASGLVEFYAENPAAGASNPYYDPKDIYKEQLPWWEPALQVGNPERLKDYPVHLITEHSRFRTHSQWFEVEMFREIDTKAYVNLSPGDMAKYGLKDDDMIRVYNDLGEVVCYALTNAGLPDGVATTLKSRESRECVSGTFADLHTMETNPYVANQAYYDCTVQIEKA